MRVSAEGIELIKKFEGCRLVAYKAVSTEKYYTIGYGHYGADVPKGMRISQAQADAFLVSDLVKFEAKVNKYQGKYNFSQPQFDALVSFAYNVGSIDGLTSNGKRTVAQISAKFTAYNKSGGKVLAGLTKRRQAEKEMFDRGTKSKTSQPNYYPKYTGTSSSIIIGLSAVGEKDTSKAYRKKIAEANGIKSYSGTASENTELLYLLKKGKLIRI